MLVGLSEATQSPQLYQGGFVLAVRRRMFPLQRFPRCEINYTKRHEAWTVGFQEPCERQKEAEASLPNPLLQSFRYYETQPAHSLQDYLQAYLEALKDLVYNLILRLLPFIFALR